MVMVLSETGIVLSEGITVVVGTEVIDAVGIAEGVDTGVPAGDVGDDWVHPAVIMRHEMRHAAMNKSTGIFFIPYCLQPG